MVDKRDHGKSYPPQYVSLIKMRSKNRFLRGFMSRLMRLITFSCMRILLRHKGGKIGRNSIVTWQIAKHANSNLQIGDECLIRGKIDINAHVVFGDNIIMNYGAEIITSQHDIDDPEFQLQTSDLFIDDFVWICPRATILPGCKVIGKGAVIGSNAVVTKDVPPMAVMGGNPAKVLRYRKNIHDQLYVPALAAGDFFAYISSRKN